MSILNAPQEFKRVICQIKSTVHGVEREFQLEEDLDIDYEHLMLEMDNFPQIYHLWSMIYSELKEQLAAMESKIKKRRATIVKTIIDSGDGYKMRKSDIDHLVDCDDDLLVLEAKKIVLDKKARKLYYTLEALKMKGDNMRSLSGFKKLEMNA